MSTITVGFSRPKKWKPFAWLIMKALNIPYDHVYIKIHSDTYQRDIIYQASSTMVNFMSPMIFDENNETIAEFPLAISDSAKTSLMQFAIDNAGIPYGIKEIFGFAAVIIAGWCGYTIKNPFKDSGSTFVCSELASYILKEFANVQLPKDYQDMTPLDTYNCLMALKI